MNIRDLKYLVALADHRHFGKAAKACFVSQPALSMQIQKLEEILEIKLLERTNKSVLFTDEGLAVSQRARDILTQVEELQEFARLTKDPYCGEIKLGIFPTLAPYFLPLIIPTLAKQFPKLSFYLVEEQTEFLVDKLKAGSLDAVFLALPVQEKNFTKVALFDEEFLLATPHHHPLAKLKKVKQSDLNDQNLLLLKEGHCLREQTLALCHKINARETQKFRATSLETLRHMVASGVGMTLIPRLACDSNKHIAYVPFNPPKPTRSICLTWRDTTAKHRLFLEIANHIKKILQKHKSIKIIS